METCCKGPQVTYNTFLPFLSCIQPVWQTRNTSLNDKSASEPGPSARGTGKGASFRVSLIPRAVKTQRSAIWRAIWEHLFSYTRLSFQTRDLTQTLSHVPHLPSLLWFKETIVQNTHCLLGHLPVGFCILWAGLGQLFVGMSAETPSLSYTCRSQAQPRGKRTRLRESGEPMTLPSSVPHWPEMPLQRTRGRNWRSGSGSALLGLLEVLSLSKTLLPQLSLELCLWALPQCTIETFKNKPAQAPGKWVSL